MPLLVLLGLLDKVEEVGEDIEEKRADALFKVEDLLALLCNEFETLSSDNGL